MDRQAGGKSTTYDELSHYVGNRLSITFLYDKIGRPLSPEALEENRQSFITGMHATIEHLQKGDIVAARGVGESELESLVKMAEGKRWDERGAREAIKDAYVSMAAKS